MSKLYIVVLVLYFILLSICVDGQISSGGLPESFTTKTLTEHFHEVIIPKPNVEELIEEDLLNDKMSLPLRFAKLLPVNLNLNNSGTWEYQKNGSRVWRLKLRSEDALSVSLYYDDFYLPEGVELFLYDESKQQLKGAYTSINNKENGLFATSMIYGESIVVELNIPENTSTKPILQISQLAYTYRELALNENSKGVEGSDFCEVNVNCSPEGDNWQQEKRGVVRIKIKIGANNYWCTGSLINNARNDMTPYVLTADHCAFKFGNYATPDELSQWIFRFKYESPTCGGTIGPVENEIVGATKVAHGGAQGTSGSDFYLLLLSTDIPWAYDPYFNGWTIDETPSSNGVTIHHPSGDIKKISTYTETLTTTDVFNSGLPSHWEVYWSETYNNWGVTEGGSSGSPLFDPGGRIVGTLTGGYASCFAQEEEDFYGKFSYHWESNGNVDTTQLKPWLDPDETGISSLGGLVVIIEPKNQKRAIVDLYPNPIESFVNLKFYTFENSKVCITLVDIYGKILKEFGFNSTPNDIRMDLSDFDSGIYFVMISFDQERIIKKLIKQ